MRTQKNIDTNKEKPKVDARRPITVELSKRDAVFGSKKDHHNCAIARACRRIPNVVDAQISRCTTYLEYEGRIVRYENSGALEKAIEKFDRGEPFPPGKYVIRPYGPSQQLNPKREYERAAREKKAVVDPGRRKVKLKISKVKSRRSRKNPETLRPRHTFVGF